MGLIDISHCGLLSSSTNIFQYIGLPRFQRISLSVKPIWIRSLALVWLPVARLNNPDNVCNIWRPNKRSKGWRTLGHFKCLRLTTGSIFNKYKIFELFIKFIFLIYIFLECSRYFISQLPNSDCSNYSMKNCSQLNFNVFV